MAFGRKKGTSANQGATVGIRVRGKPDAGSSNDSVAGQNPLARRFEAVNEPETVDLIESGRFPDREPTDEEVTRVLAENPAKVIISDDEIPDDPVAGFLVVIEGLGRGKVFNVGYGMNSIGRDPSQCIALDFGDSQIAREAHCLLSFDPVTNRFHLQAGGEEQPTFLDEELVLSAPVELKNGSQLRLGGTVLRFVPLCSDEFSWGRH